MCRRGRGKYYGARGASWPITSSRQRVLNKNSILRDAFATSGLTDGGPGLLISNGRRERCVGGTEDGSNAFKEDNGERIRACSGAR